MSQQPGRPHSTIAATALTEQQRQAAALDADAWNGRSGHWTISASALARKLGVTARRVRHWRELPAYSAAFNARVAARISPPRQTTVPGASALPFDLNQAGVSGTAALDNIERDRRSEARARWPGHPVFSHADGKTYSTWQEYADHLEQQPGLPLFAPDTLPVLPLRVIGPEYMRPTDPLPFDSETPSCQNATIPGERRKSAKNSKR
jgi:hypothetical protein